MFSTFRVGEAGESDPSRRREQQVRFWAAMIHLSQLLGLLPIFAGLAVIIPLFIWQWKKHELPEIHPHGLNVANWLLTSLPMTLLAFATLLTNVGLGLFFLGFLFLVDTTCIIIAIHRAGEGQAWKYPLAIEFLKFD